MVSPDVKIVFFVFLDIADSLRLSDGYSFISFIDWYKLAKGPTVITHLATSKVSPTHIMPSLSHFPDATA